ncbi:hypothetical protein DMP75_08865 [Klebsiella michiganensis]|nr:hypothetical protein DMP75_08865 [Klebsiella michiganensis]
MRGGVYYAFLIQSQAFNFAFLFRYSSLNPADPAACVPLFRARRLACRCSVSVEAHYRELFRSDKG